MVPPGKLPDEVGVDVAKDDVALLSKRANAGNIFQDPLDLQAGEIGRERKAGLAAILVLAAEPRIFGDEVGCACVLPDDGVIHGFAGLLVPDHCSFALIRNADSCQIFCGEILSLESFADHFLRAGPDLVRVMLHPARLGINLLVFLLGRRYDPSGTVKDDEATAGCALIDCTYVVRHKSQFLSRRMDSLAASVLR